MQAWNMLFEVPNRGAAIKPEWEWHEVDDTNLLPRPEAEPAGFIGSAGPNIPWKHWPRSAHTGLPMAHGLTLTLPDEFQRRGPHLPAIAFFGGEGHLATSEPAKVGDATSTDPFLRDLAEAEDHSQLIRKRDLIGGEWALIWLTADEAAAPVAARSDPRRPGEHLNWAEGSDTWVSAEPTLAIWLTPRADPNAGWAPRPDEAPPMTGYTDTRGADGEIEQWADDLEYHSHLGGTVFPLQLLPEGLTPWYIELFEYPPMQFGGGSAQIDLESDTFDWAT